MAHPVDVHVGKKLRLRRNMLGISQEELGKSVGITFQQVQKYERGVNRVSCSRLYEFSNILNTGVEYFFENVGKLTSVTGLAETAQPYADEQIINRKETADLINTYYNIPDNKVRQHVMSIMKAMASEQNNEQENAS